MYYRPDIRFFLATDNGVTQRKFMSLPEFEDEAVFSFGKIAALEAAVEGIAGVRHTNLQRAAIDVFLLSWCEKTHGSGHSSYSELANHLRNSRQ